MVVRKEKNGRWTVDVSHGFDPITLKQRRIVKKGFRKKHKMKKHKFAS